MTPENAKDTETSKVSSTAEEVQADVQAVMEKVGLTNGPKAVNPYEDRIFVPSEKYKGRKRAIVLYPDAKLEEVSTVEEFFGDGLKRFAADLVATAEAADAAGLSAIQVGVPTRVCVVRISSKAEFIVLVNPTVHPHEHRKTQLVTEGCLSFPGVTEKVQRYCHVNVKYQDLEGEHRQISLTIGASSTGSAAQAVQHEVEHLDGKLLLSNLNIIHRDRVRLHMKQVHRKVDTIFRKSGKQYGTMQVLFGYIPDPEPKLMFTET